MKFYNAYFRLCVSKYMYVFVFVAYWRQYNDARRVIDM